MIRGRFAVAHLLMGLAYLLMGVISAAIAMAWRNESPFVYPTAWLSLPSPMNHAYSLAIGCAFGALVVVATRVLVVRYAWARNLHRELRPIARTLSASSICLLALFSAFGEELLFRGLLQPWIGLWLSTLLFAIVHQLRGPSRWVWVAWAGLVGLMLGLILEATGSLVGCIAAHVIINWVNLTYLKTHDPEPQRRTLGGLLSTRG
jgi:membrane protease YdiL (CAAX protease family)